MPWITQREFAVLIGVSAPAVCQSLKRGRLDGATREVNGRVQIDSVKGVKIWEQNNGRPDLGGRKTGTDLAKTPKPKKAKSAKKTSKDEGEDLEAQASDILEGEEMVLEPAERGLLEVSVSRRRTEYFKACQAELDYRKELGQYVLVEDVAKEVEQEYAALSAKLKAIKIPLAQELIDVLGCGELLEVQAVIEQYINDALTELSDPHVKGTPTESAEGSQTAA